MNDFIEKRCLKLFDSEPVIQIFHCSSFRDLDVFAESLSFIFKKANAAHFRQGNIARLGLVGDKSASKSSVAQKLLSANCTKPIYEMPQYGEYLGVSEELGNVCHVDLGLPVRGTITSDYKRFSRMGTPQIPEYPVHANNPEFHLVEHPDLMNFEIPHYDMVVGLIISEGEARDVRVFATEKTDDSPGFRRFSKGLNYLRRG